MIRKNTSERNDKNWKYEYLFWNIYSEFIPFRTNTVLDKQPRIFVSTRPSMGNSNIINLIYMAQLLITY